MKFTRALMTGLVYGSTTVDHCHRLAMGKFDKPSHCDATSQRCNNLYWESKEKLNVIYISDEGQMATHRGVSCKSARALLSPAAQKRKADGQHPRWYKPTKGMERNLRRGLSSIGNSLRKVMIPSIARWPSRPFGHAEKETAHQISGEVEFLQTFLDFRAPSIGAILKKFHEEDNNWKLWKFYIEDRLTELDFARFDQGTIMKDFHPFLRIHLHLMESLLVRDERRLGHIGVEFPVIRELVSCWTNGEFRLPSLYLPGASGVELSQLLHAINEIQVRVFSLWGDVNDGRTLASPGRDENEKLENFEEKLSLLMLTSRRDRTMDRFQLIFCPISVPFTAFVSWVWSKNHRRAHRLILSAVELCKSRTSLKTRRNAMKYLPSLLKHARFITQVVPLTFSSSNREAVVSESWKMLRRRSHDFNLDVSVRFRDSVASGDGTRTLWLQYMFDYIFRPNKGIFVYANDEKQFLKPVPTPNQADLLAVGRVIALGIKYGMTIGARLTPCGIAMLRLEAFDLEECVKAEDPLYVRNLNDPEYSNEPNFETWKRDEMYQTKIKPVRVSYLLIKQGIHSVLPAGALSFFTHDEFQTMIYGQMSISGEQLLRGIAFSRDSTTAGWLKEIILAATDEFRFAFNRFVTAAAQPPVQMDEPWIFIDIDSNMRPDQLPLAQTCFRQLRLPVYPSKAILEQKLQTAVYEGNGSLELA